MLTPNEVYQIHGVTINEKIIPDGTVWKDDAKARRTGNRAGYLYKKNQKIKGGPKSVTIHNTKLGGTSDDAELYTRATWPNENMLDARVHFYVDKIGAWQNLKAGTGLCENDPEGSAEVSWHAGDGSIADGGNMTSLSLEIIMGEGDRGGKAYDNGARIAAWLLWKHNLPIEKLVTHTFWCNKLKGKIFSDPDEQCTNLIAGQKWCPSYIFGSTNHSVALSNWKIFKALVASYLSELSGKIPVHITYQSLDLVKKKWLPTVTDRQDFAGLDGHPVGGLRVNVEGHDVLLRAHTTESPWSPESKNEVVPDGEIDAIMAKSEGLIVHTQVRVKGGSSFLPDVTGYDENDKDNGYAGVLGRPIDAIYMWIDPVDKPDETTEPTPDEPTPAPSDPQPTSAPADPEPAVSDPEEPEASGKKKKKILDWIMRVLRWILDLFEKVDEEDKEK